MGRQKPTPKVRSPRQADLTLRGPWVPDEARTTLAKLDALLAPDVYRPAVGMVYGEQSKYVTWELPTSLGEVELLQITDVQFGHVMCKYERVIEYRDWILAAPNRFMFWTGDMVDAWALWSPGRPFEQMADPQSQVYRFVEVWGPARHRILGYVGGNHERRSIPGFGDLGIMIASLLRIPYSGGRQFIDIYFGDHQPFKVTLWHGAGSARTKGTIAQILGRQVAEDESQLFLMGHLHQAMVLPVFKAVRDYRRRRMQVKKAFGAVGSSFLETWNTYGEVKGFAPTDVMMAKAVLEANGKWMVALR